MNRADRSVSILEWLKRVFITAFALPVDQPATAITINIVRILFGMLILHRSFSMAQFSIIDNDPAGFETATLIAAICSLCIMVGFLTPVALIGLFVLFMSRVLLFYLGTQVAIMAIWGLLLLGAGRAYGLDALIIRRFPRYGQWLYLLSPHLTPTRLAAIRFFLIILFYGATLSAMAFHLTDELWPRGTVLPFTVTTPAMSPYHAFFASIRASAPAAFDWFGIAALFVQSIWEILLLPLMFFRFGRLFSALQGYAFFLLIGIGFQLGYLPLTQLLFWSLIFGYPQFWRLQLRPNENTKTQTIRDPQTMSAVPFSRRFSRIFILVMIALSSLVLTDFVSAHLQSMRFWQTNPQIESSEDYDRPYAYMVNPSRPLLYAFGQQPTIIFASADMKKLRAWYVLYETDVQGTPLRIVPVVDAQGARLSYFQNELFLFLGHLNKYIYDDPAVWSEKVLYALNIFIELDLCMDGRRADDTDSAPRYYAAIMFTRALDTSGNSPIWGEAIPGMRTRLQIDPGRVQTALSRCTPVWGVFPRHEVKLGLRPDDANRAETLQRIRSLAAVP